ncbi:MAG: 6-bladed beta-propeller [Gemmatimonadota bacterium]|nr:6-bladed beta-propeller [Gemmatimonadota bacterium]MDH3570563.1 6-bladed beta-propeller [Gemmatimonadota bacterium]
MRRLGRCVLVALAGTALACASESRRTDGTGVRDTLPNGTIVVRYDRRPEPAAGPLEPDLSIGVVEGDPHLVFGDVRGIEADRDGTIYVLDYQASEIRAFDAEGRFLRTLTRKGQGPGELTEANGMILVGDSVLWIQDHGKGRMIAMDLQGEELARVPMHVRSYGYIWSGTIDHRRRFWKPTFHSDEPSVWPPSEGLQESRSRGYLKSYDPATDVADSVYLGEQPWRSFIARNSRGGYSYYTIPNDPRTITIVDPAGGFWQASGTSYRIARLDEQGDTTLVIEVAGEPVLVTEEGRQRYVDLSSESSRVDRRVAEEIAALMPAAKQAISQLVVDDRGRLWARRTSADGEVATYDVFAPDGEHVGTVTLTFEPSQYLPLRIRHGRVYALVRDSLDVPAVVRTGPIPLEGW